MKQSDNDDFDVLAVKVAAEKLSKKEKEDKGRDYRDRNNNSNDDRSDGGGEGGGVGVDNRDILSRRRAAWANDETLGSYIMTPPVKKDSLNSMVQSMKIMETKGGMMEIMKTNGRGGSSGGGSTI